MPRHFTQSGLSVQYPDNWVIEKEETGDGWAVTISSPETAFMLLSHYEDLDEPAAVADKALAAMRAEYPDLESEGIVESIAGHPVVGYDVDFFTLDLTNTCWIRAVAGPEGCLLLMSQCCDAELETNGEVLHAITASLVYKDPE